MIRSAKKQIIIIGNGMAGFDLCSRLADVEATELFDITVFGEEPRPAYDRVHLTDFFADKTADELLLQPKRWYAEQRIDLHVGDKVTWIDRSRQLVHSEQGAELHYDQLIFATGSRPFVPPIEGIDLPKVFVYRTIEDLEAIQAAAATSSKAAVMGGGLLGLEAAKALFDLGLETHVLEVAPNLMPRQLHVDGASLLRKKIESLGVHVHLVARTSHVMRAADTKQLTLCFDNREPLNVDVLVVSAGIRPRDELAVAIGLAVHKRGGIEIDDHCRTSDPKIFAIGECASHRGQVYGLVGPCYQMADVVAKNLFNCGETFVGADLSATLKLMGVEVTTIGKSLGQATGGTICSFSDDEVCRQLIVEDRRVVGAMAVGPWPEINEIRDAVEQGRTVWPWELRRFSKFGRLNSQSAPLPVNQWPESATVCSCLGLKRGELSRVIADGGSTVEAIAEQTRASTVCGSCKSLLGELCGSPLQPTVPRGARGLLVASIIAAVAILAILLSPSWATSVSVQSAWHVVDLLWRDPILKQVSGYALTGIMILTLALSLRKRIRWVSIGDFGYWRLLHAVLGVATIIGIAAHTGLSLGHNLNFLLAVSFIGLNLFGAVTGSLTSLEARLTGSSAMLVRRWRPMLTHFHIWLFWPVPVLLLFHVIAVYYF